MSEQAIPPVTAPRLVGRCEVYGEIACGGMATIHVGRMRGAGGFGRTVAVKRMHAQFSRNPDFVAMFLDEARIVARVSHPNVVATLDLVEDGGDLFIIMEYVEGLSFAALLKAAKARGERAPQTVVARIITETLQGLHAAHEATDEDGEPMNVVHRDVSPDNILVGVDGHARVLDFGIARATTRVSATRDGQVKGKLAYMAPEQVLGSTIDRRTDVYSTSAILWQALTGRRLWKANNILELAHKVLNESVQPPSTVAPDVPSKFDAIVLRGLHRDLEKRWKTAAAMAETLDAVAGLATHREVGLWVRRMGGKPLADIMAEVAAVEAQDKARRKQTGVRERKSTMIGLGGTTARIDALRAEAERDAPKGPPIPQGTSEHSGVVTPGEAQWGESDQFEGLPADALASGARAVATPAPAATAAPGEKQAARTEVLHTAEAEAEAEPAAQPPMRTEVLQPAAAEPLPQKVAPTEGIAPAEPPPPRQPAPAARVVAPVTPPVTPAARPLPPPVPARPAPTASPPATHAMPPPPRRDYDGAHHEPMAAADPDSDELVDGLRPNPWRKFAIMGGVLMALVVGVLIVSSLSDGDSGPTPTASGESDGRATPSASAEQSTSTPATSTEATTTTTPLATTTMTASAEPTATAASTTSATSKPKHGSRPRPPSGGKKPPDPSSLYGQD